MTTTPERGEITIYDSNRAKNIELSEAVKYMTPEWIDAHCCQQTTIDLVAACKELLGQIRGLRASLDASLVAIATGTMEATE